MNEDVFVTRPQIDFSPGSEINIPQDDTLDCPDLVRYYEIAHILVKTDSRIRYLVYVFSNYKK